MNREYIEYVKDACENGMTAYEIQYLFNDIMQKTNTKKGKRVLKLFAQGIGKSKKNIMINKASISQNIDSYQGKLNPQQSTQIQKTFGTFKQQ